MRNLAIVCTHPIQYYAPIFKILASHSDVNLKVFYTWGSESIKKHDPGFGQIIEWDLPLLDGYNFEFLRNISKQPGSSHFRGIKNPDIISKIQQFQPSAILIFGWAYHSHLKVLRFFSGKVPIWFRGDSTLLKERNGIRKALRFLFLRWVYKHVDLSFYVGTENKKYYLHFGLKEQQLCFAPHAVDNHRFELTESNDVSIRKTLKINEDDIVILFVGKLEPVKNPEILLAAFLEIKREDIHLIFVGNGVLEGTLREKAKGCKRVHFAGFQNQSVMPAFYKSSDIFCLPSHSETWGLAVNEAMACGLAVIVSDKVGCATDLVTEGLNGLIFKSNDVVSLKLKLSTLLENKERIAQFANNSKSIISNWTFEHISNTIIERLL